MLPPAVRWCPSVLAAMTAALLLSSVSVAARGQGPAPPVQGWTPARFAPVAERLRDATTVGRVTLLEGLPHQLVEHTSFLRERETKGNVEVAGYRFYRHPLPLTAGDAAVLRTVCADALTYANYSGPKRCGGFHPDYALRWDDGRRTVYTLVCFGCHETQTLSDKQLLIADLPEPAFRHLRGILEKYHAQRPPYRKG